MTSENPTETMRDVDHTHPHTNESFGAAFKRGPAVAADGGESFDERRDSSDRQSDGGSSSDGQSDDSESFDDEQTMEDVDHEAPHEAVARAYERGTEGRDESV